MEYTVYLGPGVWVEIHRKGELFDDVENNLQKVFYTYIKMFRAISNQVARNIDNNDYLVDLFADFVNLGCIYPIDYGFVYFYDLVFRSPRENRMSTDDEIFLDVKKAIEEGDESLYIQSHDVRVMFGRTEVKLNFSGDPVMANEEIKKLFKRMVFTMVNAYINICRQAELTCPVVKLVYEELCDYVLNAQDYLKVFFDLPSFDDKEVKITLTAYVRVPELLGDTQETLINRALNLIGDGDYEEWVSMIKSNQRYVLSVHADGEVLENNN